LASNGRIIVNNELESTWEETVVTYFKPLNNNCPEETEDNQENPQSREPVFESRL